jgi:PAT family beta-lactamase induction signal transducer AmpG
MTKRHLVPVWLMGLTNLTYGLYGGVVAFAIPQLLGDRHTPEAAIASLTAIAYSPGFWAFLLSPMLDVRFSRRFYATALALISALTLIIAFLNLDNIPLLEVDLTLGFFCAYLYQSAIGGWLSTITTADQENTLSVWISIGNTAGFSLMAIGCNQIVSHLSPHAVALVLAATVLAPTLPFPFMPAPGPDRRLASESFSQFFRDLVALVKRRQVLIAIILFAAPAGTFSLTNFLGGHGADYHATPAFVGLTGCFIFPLLSRLLPLRPLYLAIGIVGSLTTLALILLPRTPTAYAIVLISQNLFQMLAITVSMAIIFDTIGRHNPLAATTFCIIGSAYGLPISYMLYVDSAGYTHAGIAGSLAFDATTGIIASLLLAAMLLYLSRKSKAPDGLPA